jgi:capsular exopolysaccharide synthesis family protein
VSVDQLVSILWRRRLSFLLAFVACVAAVVAVTLSLAKTYQATATLFVGSTKVSSYVDTTLIEQHVRTFATLAANPDTADAVVPRLPVHMTRTELLKRMSFAPVERTQLLQVTAEGASPTEAQELANDYASVFVDRMSQLYSEGKAPTQIAVSQSAARPTAPAKPNPPLYIGLGTLLSLFLALAAALVRDRLDTRIRVSADDDEALGQPVVARIPTIGGRDGALHRGVADRFGVLKTNLDFFDENPARVILVTSPGVSEGKSTIAANLALAAAADGERAVVIEADLRRPGLGNTLLANDMQRSRVGLSNYLAGAASEQEIVKPHPSHPGLSVIWAGLIPPNPTALLGSHRLDTLVNSLRLDFDRVIIDTSPISVGADASVIASHVDGTLYIIDERKTRRSEALVGLNQLRSVRARLLGIVLNRSRTAGSDGYYYQPRESDGDGRRRKRRRPEPERSESFS